MKDGKIAVFIDGSNLYATAKNLGTDVDYEKLKKYFGDSLCRIVYYTALRPKTDAKDDPLMPLVDWLSYNGYSLVTKETKEWTNAGVTKIKGNMDIEMAVDILELKYNTPDLDMVWLFSGDGDFKPVIEALHRRGCQVTVVSSMETKNEAGHSMPMCSNELRRVADKFEELKDLLGVIGRDISTPRKPQRKYV